MFFHALTFAGSRGSCLNMRPLGRMLKLLSRDPTNVNALKQTCLTVMSQGRFFRFSVSRDTGSPICSGFYPYLKIGNHLFVYGNSRRRFLFLSACISFIQ